MATSLLSPSPKQRFETLAGAPANGYKLFTYAAGTTTPQATYSDRAGSAANANPIILNARGECVIYLTPGVVYDYVLKSGTDVAEWTQPGVIADAGDASAVGFTQSGTGASLRTVQAKLREQRSVKDFGAIGDGASHPLSERFATLAEAQLVYPHATALTDQIDWAAIQAGITAAQGSGAVPGSLLVPDGDYVVNRTLSGTARLAIKAMGKSTARITRTGDGGLFLGGLEGITSIEGLMMRHTGTTGALVASAGDGLQLLHCNLELGATHTGQAMVLKHANHYVEATGFSIGNAAAWAIDIVADTDISNINGTIGEQCTIYGAGNGIRVRTGTGGRPEGWTIKAKIIVTGAVCVEVQSCLSVDLTGAVLDQCTAYGLKLAPAGSGIDGLTVNDAYIATAGASTTGKAVAAVAGTGGIRGLTVTNSHIELCGDGLVMDAQMESVIVDTTTFMNMSGRSIHYSGAKHATIGHNILRGSNIALRMEGDTAGCSVAVLGNVLDPACGVEYVPADAFRYEFAANIGKKFSGWGTAFTGSIAGGATSTYINVLHGLSVAPSAGKVVAQSASGGTGAFTNTATRINAVDATNVTVEVFHSVVTAGTMRVNVQCSA